MADRSTGGASSNSVIGIIAVVALAAFFVWFFAIRTDKPVAAAATPAPAASDNKVTIKVDLPDSVVIKP